ncbi:MAG: mannose-1-phosphate guanylyltransferase [Bacteroidales bacterium]|nr:mannose-1-phosphate guanylyltransferase [Bacteroidales bacterium]
MYNRQHYYCVILAGGIGSRFWPISRVSLPKQFLDFTDSGRSFLRMTYDRVKNVIPEENILVVTLRKYRDIVKEQLPELKTENILLEEYNRNTAPAITFAAYSLLRRDPEAVMLATPSDLAIDGQEQFEKALVRAFDFASRSDALITLGVVPTRPDPNFGYIQAAEALDEDRAVRVKTFTEKPDPDLAKVFIDTGEFLWNSGMFVWKAQSIKDELEKYAPEITMIWDGWEECLGQDGEAAFLQRVYTSDMPRTSIDYAVMEKTDKAWVYPTHFTWADIGNWDSLYDYLPIHDEDGNASNIVGKVLLKESRNNVLYSGKRGKLTAIRGLENMIVIDTDDVLLICPRDDDKFKPLLSDLALPDYKEFK